MSDSPAIVQTPLVFPLAGENLIGMLTAPQGPARPTALLVVVGGPQVRAGSHRHFVQLARHLAEAGHACLRFDVRGMGDSSGTPAGFEHLHDDIAAAVQTLMAQRPEVHRVVLWGLCDGASAALLYLHQTGDARIGGLVLLNPWVRTPQTLAQARLRHYYAQRLLQPGFWRKWLAGGVGLAALRGWWQHRQAARQRGPQPSDGGSAPYTVRMAQAWRRFPGPILLMLSGGDLTAHEFADLAARDPHWAGTLSSPRLTRVDLPGANHTFSSAEHRARVLELTLGWLRGAGAGASGGTGG